MGAPYFLISTAFHSFSLVSCWRSLGRHRRKNLLRFWSRAKHSEGEKVVLAEGDFILHWHRGDAEGAVGSPFDFLENETKHVDESRFKERGPRH